MNKKGWIGELIFTLQPVNVPEILAPAGGREQFLAAIGAGADSVYLGLKEFNARARASNFNLEELSALMPLARKAAVRVLVTLNVLIKEQEVPRLVEVLAELQWLGIFAVIVQDPGTARLVRTHFPALRLHASTQMAVHNAEGVLMARELGFRRVVLARELTMREIARIREALPREEMEIEVFCHGSLCYSYSGLCFFSGAEDARSGNRGECAYTCRQPYKLINEPGFGFLFSMKDLDTSHMVGEFVSAGVDALKIEGRKKDAQFVASSVGLYRKQLSALAPGASKREGLRLERDFHQDLDFSYQRDTTSFFLEGRYYENVIDLSNPTHKGGLAGIVRDVRGRQIQILTNLALDQYDGIRIDRPEQRYHATPQHGDNVNASFESARKFYRNEICEFSLRDLFTASGRIHSTPAGEEVWIQIPPGQQLPQKGDLAFKVRSNELKRHVDSVVHSAEVLERARPMRMAHLSFEIEQKEGRLTLRAAVDLAGQVFARAERTVAAERPRSEAESPRFSRLREDVVALFRIVGDAGFELGVEVSGDANWFVPAAELKALRRDLASALTEGAAALTSSAQIEAISAQLPSRASVRPETTQAQFSVKIDRIEYLRPIREFAAENPSFPLGDIVFEPKRMFLGRMTAAAALAAIRQDLPAANLCLAVPVVLRTWDRPGLADLLNTFADAGCSFEAANLGALPLLRPYGRPMYADFTFYALNSIAARELADLGLTRLTLSVEDDLSNVSRHLARWPASVQAQAIVFKDTPLFIAEACSLTALHNGCPTSRVCGYRTLEIENQEGERFYVAHEQCKSIVYGKRQYSVTHRIGELLGLGVTHFRIDFLTREYAPEAIKRILEQAFAHKRIPETHEANYARSLL